jgi:hypothetical protein
VKIALRGTDPLVWRRVLLPGAMTLGKLHAVVQAAMGWEDRHLHVFVIDGKSYGPPDSEAEIDERDLDENGVRIHELLDEGDHFTYEYDFGDSWIHDIDVETINGVALPLSHAVCLDGARACPLEDSGGLRGFADIVKASTDPDHPQHQELAEWFGGPFDPAAFLLGEANARIQRLR